MTHNNDPCDEMVTDGQIVDFLIVDFVIDEIEWAIWHGGLHYDRCAAIMGVERTEAKRRVYAHCYNEG